MRFIHTADWHLGNSFFSINRNEEFKSFLNWLKQQIVDQNAEALLVSGDIFDVANPSTDAQNIFYSFIASLNGTCCKNIAVVGGNHDSGQRLEIAKGLAEVVNTKIVGSIEGITPADMVFEIKNADGDVTGICCAVPYAREIELHSFIKNYTAAAGEKVEGSSEAAPENLTENSKDSNETRNFSDRCYGALYEAVYKEAEKLRGKRNIPIVATGHLYAANLEGRLANARSDVKTDDGVKVIDPVGNLGNVHSDIFPEGFDYVALGHIHYTTKVNKNPKIRYSGSPVLLGFDETQLARYVLLVDAEKGKEPEVTPVEIPYFAHFRRIEGSIEEIEATIDKLAASNETETLYIEFCYEKRPGTDVRSMLEEAEKKLPSNFVVLNRKPVEKGSNRSQRFSDGSFDDREADSLKEEEVFTQLILERLRLDGESEEGKALVKKCLPEFMKVAAGMTGAGENN